MRGRNTSSIICAMFIRNGPCTRCPKNLISLEKPLCKRPRSLSPLPGPSYAALLVKSRASKPNEFLIVKASHVLSFLGWKDTCGYPAKMYSPSSTSVIVLIFVLTFAETFLTNVRVCARVALRVYSYANTRWSVVYCWKMVKRIRKRNSVSPRCCAFNRSALLIVL